MKRLTLAAIIKRTLLAAAVVVVAGCAGVPWKYSDNPWLVEDIDEHKVKLTRDSVPLHSIRAAGFSEAEFHNTYEWKLREEVKKHCAVYGREAATPLDTRTENAPLRARTVASHGSTRG